MFRTNNYSLELSWDPSQKWFSEFDMNGRITETSIAVMLLNFTPFRALLFRLRSPDCILL